MKDGGLCTFQIKLTALSGMTISLQIAAWTVQARDFRQPDLPERGRLRTRLPGDVYL